MRTNCFLQLLSSANTKEYFSLENMNTPPKINISMISGKKGKLNIFLCQQVDSWLIISLIIDVLLPTSFVTLLIQGSYRH